MKRNDRHLKLHRETLSALSEKNTAQVGGGLTRKIDCWSGYQTCATCQTPCGTNLC